MQQKNILVYVPKTISRRDPPSEKPNAQHIFSTSFDYSYQQFFACLNILRRPDPSMEVYDSSPSLSRRALNLYAGISQNLLMR